MKKVFWRFGVALVGAVIGGKAGGKAGLLIGLIWGACVGSGFGAIFTQSVPTKRLVAFWAVTLVLVGPFFGVIVYAVPRPYVTNAQVAAAAVVGGLLGGLLGALVGVLQLKYLCRRLPTS